MADNVGYTPGTGATVSADEVTYSGDTSLVQLVRPVLTTGSEGSKTVVELPGDASNGLDVDVTRVSGNVTVVQGTAASLKTEATIANSSLVVEQATPGNLNATVVGSGNFTVVQPTASNLNANVSGTVTANAGTGSFTVVQGTASNLKTDANITNSSITVEQASAAALNATVTGTVTANAGSGSFTVAQASAAALNATVTGTVTANAGTGSFTVVQGTASNLKTDANITNSSVTVAQATAANLNATVTGSVAVSALPEVTVNKVAQYTTAQTGTALWTPASTKSVVITALQIQSYGTTAGTCIVWLGASGDTTYTRGTDASLFDGEWAPSGTNKPGLYITYPVPPKGAADYVLRLTTTNAQSITVSVWGYEV